jgi:hypothetical protein
MDEKKSSIIQLLNIALLHKQFESQNSFLNEGTQFLNEFFYLAYLSEITIKKSETSRVMYNDPTGMDPHTNGGQPFSYGHEDYDYEIPFIDIDGSDWYPENNNNNGNGTTTPTSSTGYALDTSSSSSTYSGSSGPSVGDAFKTWVNNSREGWTEIGSDLSDHYKKGGLSETLDYMFNIHFESMTWNDVDQFLTATSGPIGPEIGSGFDALLGIFKSTAADLKVVKAIKGVLKFGENDLVLGLEKYWLSYFEKYGGKLYYQLGKGSGLQQIENAMKNAENIRFAVDGFDFNKLRQVTGEAIDDIPKGGFTTWEMWTIKNDSLLLKKTTFYEGGIDVTDKVLKMLSQF